MKSLIVEDEFLARTLLVKMLEEYGTVDVAVNYGEVLEALRHTDENGEHYDLICLDINLGTGLDGLDILKKIRQQEESKKIFGKARSIVIMTTANDCPKNIMEAFSRGECDAYIIKPVTPEKLTDQLGKLHLLA